MGIGERCAFSGTILLILVMIALLVVSCVRDVAPVFDDHGGRYIVKGDAPGGASIVWDKSTGRCFIVSALPANAGTATATGWAPAEWCE